jgi:hypothetical protein
MQQDEKWNERVKYTREMAKTLTIEFPFLKEDHLISQIYELYPLDLIEALVETKTEVSNPNEVKVDDNAIN